MLHCNNLVVKSSIKVSITNSFHDIKFGHRSFLMSLNIFLFLSFETSAYYVAQADLKYSNYYPASASRGL